VRRQGEEEEVQEEQQQKKKNSRCWNRGGRRSGIFRIAGGFGVAAMLEY
jgi:hypothetical protein